jgi:hypothetical protein
MVLGFPKEFRGAATQCAGQPVYVGQGDVADTPLHVADVRAVKPRAEG